MDFTKRHARRALAKRKPPRTTLPPETLGWLAGLLEGRAWVGVNHMNQVTATIEGPPKLLTALRRRIGGVEDRKRWTMVGNKAEAILLSQFDYLVALQKPAAFALALQDYRRRLGRKLTTAEAQAALATQR